MKRDYFLAGGLIVLATLVGTAVVFPSLPAVVPVHWNVHDQPDGYGSRWTGALLMPGIMLAIMLLNAVLPWLSPRRFEMDGERRPAYLQVMIVLLVFLAWIHGVMLAAILGRHIAMGRAVMGGICALFAAIGALLPRVPRNFWVGVRTPWTLASTDVWQATHRFAAKAFVAAGVVGVALTFVFRADWPPLAAIILGGLAAVVYSLVYYKRLERRGEFAKSEGLKADS